MAPDEAKALTQAIKDIVEDHEPAASYRAWYVDELVIDCDAGEFWEVVERALIDNGRD